MTALQYEGLCRFFVAEQLGLSMDEVRSVRIPSPTRTQLHHYSHQIDLYWETWDFLTQYLNIANAKWRSHDAVGLEDVLLLGRVQKLAGAHKAVLITNIRFSSQAQSAAEDEGIGLLIVRPAFKYGKLPQTGPENIRKRAQASVPLYTYEVIKKGVDSAAPLLGGMVVQPVPPAGAPLSAPQPPQSRPAPLRKNALPYQAGWGQSGTPPFWTK